MRIQLLLEILIICAVIAFAASRVIDIKDVKENRQEDTSLDDALNEGATISVGSNEVVAISTESSIVSSSSEIPSASTEAEPINENDPNPINRYCTCTDSLCKCCRDFALPIVPVRGPGCATVRYLSDDRMSISVKYGDIVLASRTISGRKATPVCLPLPGGYSQFCGRVYGISREKDNFKACLGLELRAEDEIEAALRVSCFKFGPKGLQTTEAEPLPPLENEKDEDDDDDIFGFDDADDDDGEDDDDGGIGDVLTLGIDDDTPDEDDDDDDSDEAEDTAGNSIQNEESPDYTGFSFLDDLFTSDNKKKPVETRKVVVNSKNNNISSSSDVSESNKIAPQSSTAGLPDVDKVSSSSAVPLVEQSSTTGPVKSEATNNNEDDDDDDDDDDEDGGILSAVSSILGDDDDDDDENDDDEEISALQSALSGEASNTQAENNETDDDDEDNVEQDEIENNAEDEKDEAVESVDDEDEDELEHDDTADDDITEDSDEALLNESINETGGDKTKKKKVNGFNWLGRILRYFN